METKQDDAGWTHGTLEANGLRFHYVEQGRGPVVLMLHGFPEHWFSWRYQLPALAEAGFRAVAVDLRGYNRSDRPKKVSDYGIEKLVADIVGMIDALGQGPVHLVGHDWGGAVAWYVAAFHPDKLLSLSMMNSPHPKAFQKNLMKNRRQLARSWYMLFFQIPWLPEKLILSDIDRQFAKAFRGWARRKEMFPDEVIEALKKPMMEPGALTAGINYYRAMFRNTKNFSEAGKFPNIKVPVGVIWGDGDRALGKELNDDIAKYMDSDYEIHFIPGASHWVQQEEPEKVNELLLDYLGRQNQAG